MQTNTQTDSKTVTAGSRIETGMPGIISIDVPKEQALTFAACQGLYFKGTAEDYKQAAEGFKKLWMVASNHHALVAYIAALLAINTRENKRLALQTIDDFLQGKGKTMDCITKIHFNRIAYQIEVELELKGAYEKRSEYLQLRDTDFLFFNPDKQSAKILAEINVALCFEDDSESQVKWLASPLNAKSQYARFASICAQLTWLDREDNPLPASEKAAAVRREMDYLSVLVKEKYVPAQRQSAELALNDQKFGHGIRLLEAAATAGNATAQLKLADIYSQGIPSTSAGVEDVKADPERSSKLLQKAVESHHPEAQCVMAKFIGDKKSAKKIGFSFQPQKAFSYFKAAAENHEHPEASYYLALMIIQANRYAGNCLIISEATVALVAHTDIVKELKTFTIEQARQFLEYTTRGTEEIAKKAENILCILDLLKKPKRPETQAVQSDESKKAFSPSADVKLISAQSFSADEHKKYEESLDLFLKNKFEKAVLGFKRLCTEDNFKEVAFIAYLAALLAANDNNRERVLKEAEDVLRRHQTVLSFESQLNIQRICYQVEVELKRPEAAEKRKQEVILPRDEDFPFVNVANQSAKVIAQALAGNYSSHPSRIIRWSEPIAPAYPYANFLLNLVYYTQGNLGQKLAGGMVLNTLASKGYGLALYYFGELMLKDKDNCQSGITFLTEAAQLGCSQAAWKLAAVYFGGIISNQEPKETIVKADISEAQKWLAVAVKLKHRDASLFYAELLAEGKYGYAIDVEQAFKLIQSTAIAGLFPKSNLYLAKLILLMHTDTATMDPQFGAGPVTSAIIKSDKVKTELARYTLDNAIAFLNVAKHMPMVDSLLKLANELKAKQLAANCALKPIDEKTPAVVLAPAPAAAPIISNSSKKKKRKNQNQKPKGILTPAKPKTDAEPKQASERKEVAREKAVLSEPKPKRVLEPESTVKPLNWLQLREKDKKEREAKAQARYAHKQLQLALAELDRVELGFQSRRLATQNAIQQGKDALNDSALFIRRSEKDLASNVKIREQAEVVANRSLVFDEETLAANEKVKEACNISLRNLERSLSTVSAVKEKLDKAISASQSSRIKIENEIHARDRARLLEEKAAAESIAAKVASVKAAEIARIAAEKAVIDAKQAAEAKATPILKKDAISESLRHMKILSSLKGKTPHDIFRIANDEISQLSSDPSYQRIALDFIPRYQAYKVLAISLDSTVAVPTTPTAQPVAPRIIPHSVVTVDSKASSVPPPSNYVPSYQEYYSQHFSQQQLFLWHQQALAVYAAQRNRSTTQPGLAPQDTDVTPQQPQLWTRKG